MNMAKNRVYKNISCAITNKGVAAKNGVQPKESDLGLIKNAAIAWSDAQGIQWVGPTKDLPKKFRASTWKTINANGLVAYPGLVDPHTHMAFAGDRAKEFELRMAGASYQDIANAGGGILSTVSHTREASKSALVASIKKRLQESQRFGVRLLETKSGYGLTTESEIKSLQAIQSAAKSTPGIKVVGTCMAAHAIPVEYKKNPDAYVDLIISKILPAAKRFAQYVDVFCDQGYFSVPQTEKIFKAAKAMGFGLRVHGEELAHTGITELAVQYGASSVDHLLKISESGIAALAKGNTVATLLPATSFYLKEPPAPARKLIKAGVPVALATDFNPGSSPTQNLPFVGTLAALHLEMTTAEIIAGITWNAARSLSEQHQYGAIMPGYKGLPVFFEGDHPSSLFYKLASQPLVF